jgi:hypothetical protein
MPKQDKPRRADISAQVDSETCARVLAEARDFGKTKDSVMEAALRDYVAKKKEERRRMLASYPNKRLGRPIGS